MIRRPLCLTSFSFPFRGFPLVRCGQRRLHHSKRNVRHRRCHLPNGGRFNAFIFSDADCSLYSMYVGSIFVLCRLFLPMQGQQPVSEDENTPQKRVEKIFDQMDKNHGKFFFKKRKQIFFSN